MRLTPLLALPLTAHAFDWDTIQPSPNLTFHACYTSYECARLSVPLNYADPGDLRTAALALIKLPAPVAPSSPLHGGPIFFNPGGPSGSGVSLVLEWGEGLREIVDTPGERYYDILSWDPRGVGLTQPRAQCYEDAIEGTLDNARDRPFSGFPTHEGDYAAATRIAFAVGRAALCAKSEGVQYMSTASTARDLVEMVDAIEASKHESEKNNHESGKSKDEEYGRVDLKRDVAKLQYVGFSYGTVLGSTFAALFPERVGRLVLDGVVDSEDYVSSDGWQANLYDTNELAEWIWEACFAAGAACPIFHPDDTSGSTISSRVNAYLHTLDVTPAIYIPPVGAPRVITAVDVRRHISFALYTPMTNSLPVMEMLAETMQGNYSRIVPLLDGPSPKDILNACENKKKGLARADSSGNRDAQVAILCGDSGGGPTDAAYWTGYARSLVNQSELFGGWWIDIRLGCAGWRVTPEYRFKGPFEASTQPILFLTTELDPVTPRRNAYRMARGYPGSAVVLQRGGGHCALRSSPSGCTGAIVREYLRTGKVPQGDTVCEPDCEPWSEDEECKRFRPWGSL